jgi:phosphomannomutase
MSPKFGTSGLRGLVTELTPALIRDHLRAFVAACPAGGAVHVGRDLRPSSPDIAAEVMAAVGEAGLVAVDAGPVPTPALALAAMGAGHAAVMVTGSHIPADRNGLKFYVPGGEISKTDEAAILAGLGVTRPILPAPAPRADPDCAARYAARYVAAFGPGALAGLRIGIWQHSTVIRDLLGEVVAALGAVAVPFGRSEHFIPVDTEAVEPGVRAELADGAKAQRLDAVISADGDADRPLLADAAGTILPGDVLGPLTARYLDARVIVTPVSSNTLVERLGFGRVLRTRIGSPFVIAGMEAVLAADRGARVAGYEANGGFLLGFAAEAPQGLLAPLMTRDCLLPLLGTLAAARAAGQTVGALAAALPSRFTAAGRLQGIEPAAAGAWLARLAEEPAARAAFLASCGGPGAAEVALDRTDGLRMTRADGTIVHLRPSGNAPEFRVYAEAGSTAEAEARMEAGLAAVAAALGD